MNFQGLLSDLQDWEVSRKGKTSQMNQTHKENKSSGGDTISFDRAGSYSGESYGLSRNNDLHMRSFAHEDFSDAVSEKDLGNEFFKQKKFKEAIDCYSRSIALSPTALAYANRAMAYIKLKRFQKAEDDCTEALNLDDRYIKAYSRRATARKELGKIKGSMDDAEFALRLEPDNQEIKKQYADAKSLYEKGIVQIASGALRSTVQESKKVGKSEPNVNGGTISHGTQKIGPTEVYPHTKGNDSAKASLLMEEVDSKDTKASNLNQGQEGDSSKRNQKISKPEIKASIQELASRAASRAMAEASKNITPPTTAYQFEASWRSFSGDRALQTRLLKAISPHELPKIFRNALSSALLIDIIKCVASFFIEDVGLGVSYLEHLAKVPRFDMIVMCLSSTDKDVLRKIWDEVFCSEAIPIEYAEILDNLRSKFSLGQ
ncbi:PREDICTED: RNA polymerase II-associated protein 3 isoform X1 [Lupinus angustifolius]|uniref:RNA polymerase II-associated protein 3 isoform X1 n=1 Tax=Lupinus angustifolius TaxID=3871 RepID=UPI00092EBF93|nr:PREDICTED: RNA polymerase II-associated protein 3 isoform X1 [Lupinus angustifolius]